MLGLQNLEFGVFAVLELQGCEFLGFTDFRVSIFRGLGFRVVGL